MPGKVPSLDLSLVQIPHHFRCPISLELMRDPVTVCTGQTYDRSSIESWVATGNTTCPVTRHPLPCPPALIPNHTLRRLIQQWSASHLGSAERVPTPKHSPADPSLLRSLLALSTSPSALLPRRLSALRRLRSLSSDHRARLLLSDHRHPIVHLAFSPDSPADLSLEAIALLSTLPLPDADCRAIASRTDRIALLASLLRSHPDARTAAASMIEAVAAGTRSADLRAGIGSSDGVMEGLVAMARAGEPAGVRAIHALCVERRNRGTAAGAGAVAALAAAVVGEGLTRAEVERAAATVEVLVRAGEGEEGDGVVPAMAGVLEAAAATDRAAEHAAGAIVAACERWGESARRMAMGTGVVAALLVMVQGGCTERGRRKAQMLLKLLLQDGARVQGNSDEFLLLPLPTKRRQAAAAVAPSYY